MWDAASGALLFQVEPGFSRFVEFSPDGTLFVTGGRDHAARLWSSRNGEAVAKLAPHGAEVQCAVFSPDGERVLTASKDKTARLWSCRTGEMLMEPLKHADELGEYNSAQFSPDGLHLVTAAGNAAQIWDAKSGKPATPPIQHDGRVNSVRFSPDSKRLVTACYDGTARIWDVATGLALSEPLRHAARVAYAEFSPDGRRVVTASTDKTARVWNIAIHPEPAPGWLCDLAEAVAGQRIDESDTSAVVPVDELFFLRQRFSTSSHMDSFHQWAKWFFADSVTRTISPWSNITTRDYLQRLVDDDLIDGLREAVRASPTNALALARLARHLSREGLNNNARARDEAAFLIRLAEGLAPAHPEIAGIRADIDRKRAEIPE